MHEAHWHTEICHGGQHVSVKDTRGDVVDDVGACFDGSSGDASAVGVDGDWDHDTGITDGADCGDDAGSFFLG